MDRSFCRLPIMPMRREPSHSTEMVSMLLFGESFEVLEKRDVWSLIRSEHDTYEGWIRAARLPEADKAFWEEYDAEIPAYTSEQFSSIEISGEKMLLSPGSRLPLLKGHTFYMGTEEAKFVEGSFIRSGAGNAERLESIAGLFLNAPYLWGGRNIMGIDCSGLVQLVFRLCGLSMPRDAWQQAERGGALTDLSQAACGDLAFFAEGGSKITHVGILLDHSRMIHASERVRIDTIDENGVFNSDLQKYTLQSLLIKRYF